MPRAFANYHRSPQDTFLKVRLPIPLGRDEPQKASWLPGDHKDSRGKFEFSMVQEELNTALLNETDENLFMNDKRSVRKKPKMLPQKNKRDRADTELLMAPNAIVQLIILSRCQKGNQDYQ